MISKNNRIANMTDALHISMLLATKSDMSKKHGAVLIHDGNIISAGYSHRVTYGNVHTNDYFFADYLA